MTEIKYIISAFSPDDDSHIIDIEIDREKFDLIAKVLDYPIHELEGDFELDWNFFICQRALPE